MRTILAAVERGCVGAHTFLQFLLEKLEHHKTMNVKACFMIWLEKYYFRLRGFEGRGSIHESINWNYDQNETTQKSTITDNSDLMIQKLTDIMSKEKNTKIKRLFESHLSRLRRIIEEGAALDEDSIFNSTQQDVTTTNIFQSSVFKEQKQPKLQQSKKIAENSHSHQKSILDYSNDSSLMQQPINSQRSKKEHLFDWNNLNFLSLDSIKATQDNLQLAEEVEECCSKIIQRMVEQKQSIINLNPDVYGLSNPRSSA